MTAVRVPEELWDTRVVPQGVVSSWYYDEGARVEAGAVLAVIMVEKSEYDIEAPAAGRLHIIADANTTVVPGAVIGDIANSQ